MITKPVSEFEPNAFDTSAAGHRCVYCGEFLQDPAVVWNGYDDRNIFLHGPCVVNLFQALLRDALELKYANHPCWNQLNKQ